MNLVKVFCLTRGSRGTFDNAQHGLSQQLVTGGRELTGASLVAHPSVPANNANNFDEFMQVLTGSGLRAITTFEVLDLVPQILPGHRLWSQATHRTERFIGIHDLQFMYDSATRQMWLNIYFLADDLSRLGVTYTQLLTDSRLAGKFASVKCSERVGDRYLICFQQTTTHPCPNGYPADHFAKVTTPLRHLLWSTVATVPPNRRYYVYLAPAAEHPFVLPQLLSIYALIYYFGSITRYRPHQFDHVTRGKFGPWAQEFINGQPLQFLYLLASEFIQQDVTRPSIL